MGFSTGGAVDVSPRREPWERPQNPQAPEGRKIPVMPAPYLSPLRGLFPKPQTHGFRRGLTSIAALQLRKFNPPESTSRKHVRRSIRSRDFPAASRPARWRWDGGCGFFRLVPNSLGMGFVFPRWLPRHRFCHPDFYLCLPRRLECICDLNIASQTSGWSLGIFTVASERSGWSLWILTGFTETSFWSL